MMRLVGCFLLGLLLLTSAVSAQDSTPSPSYLNYTMMQGDTVASLALRYGTTIQAILDANNIGNPNRILVGTVLRIPLGTPPGTAAVPVTGTAIPEVSGTAQSTVTALPSIGFELGGAVYGFSHAEAMHSAEMTWAKVQLRWNPGDPVDSARIAIQQAHKNKFKILLQISGNPPADRFDPAQYFLNYVTYLGDVAALKPDGIEVWNAMNVAGTPDMSNPAVYAAVLKAAFSAIKTANPQTLVVSGALAPINAEGADCSGTSCDNLAYLDGMAQAGVGKVADCIALPYMLGTVPPDNTSGDPRGDQAIYYYPKLVASYASIFPDKPLCVSDIGYLVVGDVPLPSSYQWAVKTSPDQRGEWLARAAVLARMSGRIRLMIVDNVDATPETADAVLASYALVAADGSCPTCLTLGAALGSP